MKKNLAVAFLAFSALLLLQSVMSSSGKAGYTGSPNESTCAACHGGGSGTTSVEISANPPFLNNEYIPGNLYTISVKDSNADYNLFGFGCEILDSLNQNAGEMTTALAGVKFLFSGSRKNAVHSNRKSGVGTATFQFEWTAPTSGTATIYASGNAVDGSSTTSGDNPANTSLTLTPATISSTLSANFQKNFIVYPNPVKDNLSLLFQNSEIGQNLKVDLLSADGKVFTIFHGDFSGNRLNIQLPENINSGIYWLSIRNKDQILATEKLIINR